MKAKVYITLKPGLLDAQGKNRRAGDATRIKQWLESDPLHQVDLRHPAASRT